MPTVQISTNCIKICTWFFLICLTFFSCQCISAHTIQLAVLPATLAALLLSLTTGVNIISRQRCQRELCALYCLVIGSLLASGFLLISTLITASFKLSAIALFIGNIIALVKRWHLWFQLRLSNAAVLASLLALTATICWSQENIAGLAIKPNVVLNRPWQDIFFHSTNIALLAQTNGSNSLHSPFIRDCPLPPYHYASYMLASLISLISNAPTIAIASGFYVPFGFFLTVCAAYCFGAELFRKSAGLLAAGAVSLIPDPASLHLASSIFSYYFFQEGGGVNGSYGVACFALAWLSLFSAFKADKTTNLKWAACLLILLALFKIQIFLVYSCIFCSFFLVCFFQKPQNKIWALAIFYPIYFLLVQFSQHFTTFPTLRFSTQGSIEMVPMLGSINCCTGLVLIAHTNPHYIYKTAIGLPIYILITYGVWLPLSLFASVTGLRLKQTKPLAIFLFLTLLNNCVVAFALAPNKGFGDIYEIIHKTFVWPVFATAICSTCVIYTWFATKGYLSIWSSKMRPLAALALMILILNIACIGKTLLRSLDGGTGLEFPKGLYDCAIFLRKYSLPGSTVQFCGNDKYQFLTTCSERFPFVSKLVVNPVAPDEKIESEISELSALPSGSFKAAKQLAKKYDIQWLVVDKKVLNGEPFQGKESPIFSSKEYQVYRTGI
jgi:hypothetical protein